MLGRRLRSLREAAGMSLEEAAPQLEWSTSKLSRIEIGQQTVDVHGVRSMLDLYDGGDVWGEVLDLARSARRKSWWHPYDVGDDGYVAFEAEAVVVHDFTLDYVPGLLQTAEYAQALLTSSFVQRTAAQLADAVAVRRIRQQRLRPGAEHPLELVAIVAEAVLHHAVGGPDVLAGQRAHLAEAARLPSAAPRRAVDGSGLTMLAFGDLGEPDVAFVEHALGSVRIEKEADLARARLGFDRLRSDALSPSDTRALLDGLAAG
jgi:hypothetical protein